MNYLNGKYHVEVKDKRYIIHPIDFETKPSLLELNIKFKMILKVEKTKDGKLQVILKRNNQIFINQNLNHLIAFL